MKTDETPGIGPPPFDLMESPITGTTLIEAGAGTGKTYTITGIVLRLIIERGITINRILVVTFTEAATEELKSRIRGRLKEALPVFRGEAAGDDFLGRLAERCRSLSPSAPDDAVRALTDALRDFDEAAIFTIHGFCNRMLRENAFESGTLFDTELTADQDRVTQAVVEDYWRTRMYTADPVFVRYALAGNTGPGELFQLLGRRLSQPEVAVIPVLEAPDTRAAEADFKEAYALLQRCWSASGSEVGEILLNDPGLKRNVYAPKSIPGWMDLMDLYLRPEIPHPVPPQKFENFTPETLKNKTKKGFAPPKHPFFDLCGDFQRRQTVLADLYARKLIHLKRELFPYARAEIRRRMQDANIQSFDDLLVRMSEALKSPGGGLLADTIRGRYQAALIDEFQDTDPVQYHIFQTLFDIPGHLLFLIGDPKQAIYSFRGADIFAYMAAAEKASARYTLLTNWRSDPGLITAVNTVFGARLRPFVYAEIPFGPARAPDRETPVPGLAVDGESPAPLTIWRLKSAGKGDAESMVFRATAAEISRLLDLGRKGRATIGGSPLRPGDIAVLVRTNRQAGEVQAALTALSIPSVIGNTGDIFDTHEAAETARILAALAEPRNDRLIRAALASDMMGISGEALACAALNEAEWETLLARMADYHRLWQERGFIRMFKAFLAGETVLPRLMSLPGGERRCTNILHLSELLHQAGTTRNMTPSRLIQWLSEQRFQADRRSEEHPLRLESDENAVRLVTIHKSKGLEYPVVFCPVPWARSRLKKTESGISFHDEGNRRRPTVDLGSEQVTRHRALAEKETLAENLRLLYVAVTRAKHMCALAWGLVNDTETSAPAYLFHGEGVDPDEADLLGPLESRVKGMHDEECEDDLAAMAGRSGGTVHVRPLPEEDGVRFSPSEEKTAALEARRFSGRIPHDFNVSSFTSIISGATGGTGGIHDPAELADHDALAAAAAGEESPAPPEVPALPVRDDRDIMAFPRGALAGTCLHEIFEHLDFRKTREEDMAPLIRGALRKYRFDDLWVPAVAGMVGKVVRQALDPEDGKGVSGNCAADGVLTLSAVPPARRINEMGFYFPLKSMSSRRLETVFAEHGIIGPSGDFPERIGRLEVSRARGMMKGFIDLVFAHGGRYYIVDWKSNHLGDRPEDYRPAVLAAVMADTFYILQYHLYALALHRYLKHRLPGYDYDTHFGGVRYLFLRGIDPEIDPSFGMFKDRPKALLIRSLEALLVDAPADKG